MLYFSLEVPKMSPKNNCKDPTPKQAINKQKSMHTLRTTPKNVSTYTTIIHPNERRSERFRCQIQLRYETDAISDRQLHPFLAELNPILNDR